VVGRAAFILPAITPAKEVSHCFIVRTQSRCSRLSSVLAGDGLLGQPSKFAIGVVHKAIQEAARDLGTKIHRSRKRFD